MKSLHGRPLEPLEEMLVIAMLVFSMVSAGRIHNHRTTTSNQSPDKEWKLQQFSTHGKSRSTLSSDKHGFSVWMFIQIDNSQKKAAEQQQNTILAFIGSLDLAAWNCRGNHTWTQHACNLPWQPHNQSSQFPS